MAIVFFIAFLVATIVYLTSKFEESPPYHWVFGYIGFVISVIWIYGLANEVVDLLKAIGIMFSLSDAILGLTVLAWETAWEVSKRKIVLLFLWLI